MPTPTDAPKKGDLIVYIVGGGLANVCGITTHAWKDSEQAGSEVDGRANLTVFMDPQHDSGFSTEEQAHGLAQISYAPYTTSLTVTGWMSRREYNNLGGL